MYLETFPTYSVVNLSQSLTIGITLILRPALPVQPVLTLSVASPTLLLT
jgi:hypothetical protein